MVFLFVLIGVFIIFNIVISHKNIKINWNYKGYIENIKNHIIFYKIMDFLALNNLFKGF